MLLERIDSTRGSDMLKCALHLLTLGVIGTPSGHRCTKQKHIVGGRSFLLDQSCWLSSSTKELHGKFSKFWREILNENFFYSFFFESERGVFPQTEFVFDLELPVDFVPTNNDGEVDEFELVPVAQVSVSRRQ